MHRVISSFVMILLFGILAWASVAWYFGERNQQQFNQFIDQLSQSNTAINIEQNAFKKNWLGATVRLSITSDIPVISEKIGEMEFIADIKNGPVFFSKDAKNIRFGKSLWKVQINEENLTDSQKQYLQEVFSVKLPSLNLLHGFDDIVDYQLAMPTEESNVMQSKIRGKFNVVSQDHKGLLEFKNVSFKTLLYDIDIPSAEIHYKNNKTKTIANLPLRLTFKLPQIKIKQIGGSGFVRFDVEGSENILLKNNIIDGSLNIILNNIDEQSQTDNSNTLPMKEANIDFTLNDISTDALFEFNNLKMTLNNLTLQKEWVLEEQGELPEGQDEIWQLQQEYDSVLLKLHKLLEKQLFNSDKGKVTFKVLSEEATGNSSMEGEIQAVKTPLKSMRLTDLLEARANVALSDELFAYLKGKTGIPKATFQLLFKQNKLLMQ